MQLETASNRKMKDWRILLLQYLLQQNRSVPREEKAATGVNDCKQYCGMPLLTNLAVIRVSRRTSERVQKLGIVRQFSLSGRLFRVKIG